jgi:VIT1/CCC1 family predicted Fe2+/Mn2+ transporter
MKTGGLYLRTIIFGVTDSLVSMVGLLAGISVAGVASSTIVLTGIVYAFVEAFSMAVGNFLSEESVEEYNVRAAVNEQSSLLAGVVMFITSVLAAFIPIAPYVFLPAKFALVASVFASVAGLFVLGVASARVSSLPIFGRGLRMALLGGAAIIIGVLVGRIVPAA